MLYAVANVATAGTAADGKVIKNQTVQD